MRFHFLNTLFGIAVVVLGVWASNALSSWIVASWPEKAAAAGAVTMTIAIGAYIGHSLFGEKDEL